MEQPAGSPKYFLEWWTSEHNYLIHLCALHVKYQITFWGWWSMWRKMTFCLMNFVLYLCTEMGEPGDFQLWLLDATQHDSRSNVQQPGSISSGRFLTEYITVQMWWLDKCWYLSSLFVCVCVSPVSLDSSWLHFRGAGPVRSSGVQGPVKASGST